MFSTYPHRILFGAAMAIGSMLALTSVIEGRRRIAWAVLPLLAAALYFSFSRGPWLAMIVCLAVVGLLVDRRFLKAGAVLALAAVVVFVARPGTWGTIQSLYHSTFDEQSIKGSSFQWRFLVLERSLESILGASEPERALFGHGEGSHLYLEHVPVLMSTGHYGTFVSWDNEFAVLLYERGILGFLPTLFIDGLFFLGSLRFLRAHPGHPSGVAFLSIFLILVFMSTNVKMFAPQLVYLQGIALAGGMSLARGGSGGR